jgi:hypothetical protein
MLEFWYEALSEPIGIVLVTNNLEAAKQALYKARRDCGDSDLASLTIRVNPLAPDRELFIMKSRG